VNYIDQHKRFGVVPICKELQFAPSTYYAAKSRPICKRQLSDARLKREFARIYEENYSVYGVVKMWKQLQREGFDVGRDQVARLMKAMGIQGVIRGKAKRTTIAASEDLRPADLVQRNFRAPEPNRLWVADLTYVKLWSGFAYTWFVVDVFSRRIVGWKVSRSMHAQLAVDALDMAVWQRKGDLKNLVHHSDRGTQYVSIRYTDRLADEGVASSVGSRGDSYDNALAETVNGLYKAELIHRKHRWDSAEQVERATAAWVDWWNNRRLHSFNSYLPPAEFEAIYYAQDHKAA
jgi:putative transposase